jgi:hypothetical protein
MLVRRSTFVIIAACLAACSQHGSSPIPNASAPNQAAARGAEAAQSEPVPYGPVSFSYTGKPATYVVPAGVTSVSVTLYGALSGGNNGAGFTQATIPVKPGEALAVNVGGQGTGPADAKHAGAGGYNGGADGAPGRCCFQRGAGAGWGGGGATIIQHADGRWAAIAGGAGGNSGSANSGGSGGGKSGADAAHPEYSHGGQGGTQDCGSHSSIGAGTGGSSSSNSAYGGGGGGGGYCGGQGGGGSSSHSTSSSSGDGDVGDTGGGGGSGYFEPGSTSASTTGNAGQPASVLIVPPPKVVPLFSGLKSPWGVAVDTAGNVYVADTGNGAVRKIASNGSLVQTISGFTRPEGVAVDGGGNVYVADYTAEKLVKVAPDGTRTTIGDNRNFESVAVRNDGSVFTVFRGHSSIRNANYWELYQVNNSVDVYWDWETGDTPHEIATQNNCASSCPVYAGMETFQGKDKPTGHAVWSFSSDGSNAPVAGISIVPDAGLAYNGVTLWAASTTSHAVCGLLNGKCAPIGSNWSAPNGLAVTPNCSQLCTLYIVDQGNGTVSKLVP